MTVAASPPPYSRIQARHPQRTVNLKGTASNTSAVPLELDADSKARCQTDGCLFHADAYAADVASTVVTGTAWKICKATMPATTCLRSHSLFHGDANRYTALSVVVYVSYLRDRRHRRAELLPLKPQTLSHSVLPQHGNEVKIEAQFFTHVAPISGRTPTGTSIVNRDHTDTTLVTLIKHTVLLPRTRLWLLEESRLGYNDPHHVQRRAQGILLRYHAWDDKEHAHMWSGLAYKGDSDSSFAQQQSSLPTVSHGEQAKYPNINDQLALLIDDNS
ncbi:hypothetical protein CHU98_g9406 [Xylaria longipes]|nr:hypothetical protein CHU98_g9406 [Xylaria longipes]